MSFDPAYIQQARQEILNAPYGEKTCMSQKWADILDISPQHLHRLFNSAAKKSRRGLSAKSEYEEYSKIVFQIKNRPPEEAGAISTEDALAIAIKSGQLPETAALVPVGTYNRIGREKGWNNTILRANRFQAEKPNQAHHFDASTSKYLYIAKKSGDDYILKPHRPAKHYKNKPIPVDALRPWIYAIVDDYSGRIIARYTAAQGETSADSMSFLAHAWADMGLCEKLLADQGMLKKALPSQDLMERLGVDLPESMPYAKRAHGKIERPWRTIWLKFELPFFSVDNWEKFEISLSELNQQLSNFISDKYNQLSHRFEKNITRMQAWSRVNLHGGIVKIPENALATAAKRRKRKVGIDGLLQYEGTTYEVKGLHAADVYVFEGVFEDRLVVQDIRTGQKYEVKDFKPLNLGEYKAHPATPYQELQKSQSIEVAGTLYAEKKPADKQIISMPIKTQEREIADPFDVTTYASLDEAMQELAEIVGTFISKEQREVIEKLIAENSMKKSYVKDLALEIRGEIEQRRSKAIAM